jgi:hypothetical protein
MRRWTEVLACLVLVCGLAAEASAQGNVWGVSASFTPRWTTPEGVKAVFLAEEVSLEGQDLRLGIVRGRTQGSDWGLSFVRQTIKAGGVVDRDDVRDVLERDVQITGAVLENYGAIITIQTPRPDRPDHRRRRGLRERHGTS